MSGPPAVFARPCTFSWALPACRSCRRDAREVAFAGRSNVGKSSLINALTGRTDLARTSNTPGRTRELNFFTGEGGCLVDLPGYGYAKAPKAEVRLAGRAAAAICAAGPASRGSSC